MHHDFFFFLSTRASLVAKPVKNLPTMQETGVWFLAQEDPLEKDMLLTTVFLGFPCDSAGKKMCLQCRRPGFDPWVGKIPWRREWIPTPVFSPGEFHGLYTPWGCKELDMTEWLSQTLYKNIIFFLIYCLISFMTIFFL